MAAPLQYPLCCQTVTFYHADPAAHTITRTVVQGVHFDTRRRETAAGGSGPQAVRPRRFCWLSRKNMRRLAGIIRWNPMTACLQAPGRR